MKTDLVQRYVKRPVVISAIQFTGANIEIIRDFMGKKMSAWQRKKNIFYINTLEGLMIVNVGDYIIRGVVGEYYPVRQDIFEITYEEYNDGGFNSESASSDDMGAGSR